MIVSNKNFLRHITLCVGITMLIFTESVRAACNVTLGVWTCAGVTTSTQSMIGTSLVVETDNTFSSETQLGNALTLIGTNGLSYIDIYGADITGAEVGISADNRSSGALLITTIGTVTGISDNGIAATNVGSDLTVNVMNVSGAFNGIDVFNDGMGATSITATGMVAGGIGNGIFGDNMGTDLIVNVVDVSGGYSGIDVVNFGTGATSVTATGTVIGFSANGIYASTDGTGLTVNVYYYGELTFQLFFV